MFDLPNQSNSNQAIGFDWFLVWFCSIDYARLMKNGVKMKKLQATIRKHQPDKSFHQQRAIGQHFRRTLIKAVFLKLCTINVHQKRNKLHPQCCCHSNSFGSSFFQSKKTNTPIYDLLLGTDSIHVVITLINRLCGVDGSWFQTKTGNFSFY